jgi:hypothetical protein
MFMHRFKYIIVELKRHAPFTALGAFTGTIIMSAIVFVGLHSEISYTIFHVLHPAHLLLSSAVTATMFKRYGGNILASVVIGIAGAIAICTISDVVLPHLGGMALGSQMTFHLDIVEKPWLVFSPTLVGATIGALILRWTRCPHAAHVLISTSASLFYLMAFGVINWLFLFPLVFAVLFIAVWIPCCTSDIVFPLLFMKVKKRH